MNNNNLEQNWSALYAPTDGSNVPSKRRKDKGLFFR